MDKIKTGKFTVISSGSFLTSQNDISTIPFKRENEKVTIELKFIDKDEQKVKIEHRGSKEDIVSSFEMPKIESTSGEGFANPIQFAAFDNGDLMYLHLWVRKLNRAYIKISYSIYVEEIKK